MKIVLVGYMGSGKSTIGRLVADTMDLEFLDLDKCLETALNMPIPKIFQTKGELYFRKQEHYFLKEVLSRKEKLILATGGGTPCYSGNLDTMLQLADHVFYLKVSLPELVRRLSMEKEDRPLIRDIANEDLAEFIGKHLFERNVFYNRATHTIQCDQKSPQDIAEEICGLSI